MKRNLIVAIAFILIATHVIPSYNISFANEEENDCELMNFTVQTIKENDDKLEGKASDNQEFEIEFIRQGDTEKITSDNKGKIKYEFEEDYLKQNDKVIITNEYHKIETTVTAEDDTSKTIDSEEYVECAVIEEKLETSDETEDEINKKSEDEGKVIVVEEDEGNSEELKEIEKNAAESSAEEAAQKPEITEQHEDKTVVEDPGNSETGEKVEETGVTEEPEKEEGIEKTEDTQKYETVEESDEIGVAEESEVVEGSEEGKEPENSETAGKNEETMISKSAESEEETEETTIHEDVETEKRAEENLEEAAIKDESFEKSAEENQEEDSNKEELSKELTENQTKNTMEEEKIKKSSTLKQLEIGRFSTSLYQASQAKVSNAKDFNNALSNRNIEVIELETDITSSGVRNVYSNTNQKVINANGHSINMGNGRLVITNSVDEMIVRNANLFTSNSNRDEGFFEKTGTDVNLHLENIKFNENNNLSGGKLGSNWEGEVHFYGTNLINTRNGSNTLAFRKVFVHENATLDLNHQSSGGALFFHRNSFSYGDGEYGLEVYNNAEVNVHSNSAVMISDLSWGLNILNRSIIYKIQEGADVILTGTGEEIFSLDASMEVQINNPKTVDFINKSNNRLFSSNRNIDFSVQQSSIHGWKDSTWNTSPSHMTPIVDASFNFGNHTFRGYITEVKKMTPSVSGFSNDFPPTMSRIMFDHSEAHLLDLNVDDISDTDIDIAGITGPNAEVIMYDGEDNKIDNVTSSSSGEFTFTMNESFQAGDILKFKSRHLNNESEIVDKIVIGNRLELLDVPNAISFETTEIKDEKIIIERENPNMTVSVMDTRSNNDWYLTAQALAPLTDEEGNNSLNEALYYIEDNSEEMIEDEAVRVGEKNQSSGSDVQELSWGAGEGVLLKLNPIAAQADTEYSTTIEWILTDGP